MAAGQEVAKPNRVKRSGEKTLKILSELTNKVKSAPEKLKKVAPPLAAEFWAKPAKEFAEFLKSLRNPLLQSGRMTDTPESHANLEPLTNRLRAGDVSISRDNRIIIECKEPEETGRLRTLLADPDKNTAYPTVSPAGFLKNFSHIAQVICKSGKAGEKSLAKLVAIGEISQAYLEILDEMDGEPLPNGDEFSDRTKRYNPQVAAWKETLLDQAENEPMPTGTPSLNRESIEAKAIKECRRNITTGDALQLAVILAERELTEFKTSKKRETLFKMRAKLTSDFFEVCKTFRADGHPADRILPQKPRYKTPCVTLVRHSKYEHCEVVCINAQSSLSYWGNPESEQESHAIVTSEALPEAPPKALEANAKKAVRWIIIGIFAQVIIMLGVIVGLQSCSGEPKGEIKQQEPALSGPASVSAISVSAKQALEGITAQPEQDPKIKIEQVEGPRSMQW